MLAVRGILPQTSQLRVPVRRRLHPTIPSSSAGRLTSPRGCAGRSSRNVVKSAGQNKRTSAGTGAPLRSGTTEGRPSNGGLQGANRIIGEVCGAIGRRDSALLLVESKQAL